MSFRATLSLPLLIAALLLPCAALRADDVSFEGAAEKLQAATLTVRVSRDGKDSPEVTVFTGVSLGKGIVVTPLFSPDDVRIRVTLPGGQQAEARALVLDEYSGLALLKIDNENVPGLTPAEEMPKVGVWVMSGAGWGVEKAVVSMGVLGGVDRSLAGANYPPLLQCDLRTAETSSGAAVVNSKGELLGVVVAAESSEGRRGWTYAVPVKHVQRLLRARPENDKGRILIPRRRPVVGMVLGPQDEQVVVKQVTADGPAAKAGIHEGDKVLAADGIVIRSVYQAVRPLLYKQPGDTMGYLVRGKDGEVRTVEVVLGGGVALPSSPSFKVANVMQPKVIVSGQAAPRIARRKGNVAEVFAPGSGPADGHTAAGSAGAGDAAGDNAPIDLAAETIASLMASIKLQEKALEGYRNAIAAQHEKLDEAEQQRKETEEEILRLKAQVEELTRQLQSAKQGR